MQNSYVDTCILKHRDCICFVPDSLHRSLEHELWHTFAHLISRSQDFPTCSQHTARAEGNLCVEQWIFTALLPKKLSDSMAFSPGGKGCV